MAVMRIVVSGSGHMGREILAALSREADMTPIGVIEKFSTEKFHSLPDGSGLIPMSDDPEDLIGRVRPDVVVDFTNADWTPRVAMAALGHGARPVIGTTGLSDAFIEKLRNECRS